MSRLNFYCGLPVKHCGWYPDVQVRLFDKRYANWNMRDVAEKVIFRDNISPVLLDGDILHYRCETPGEYAEKERNHAYILAHDIAAQKGEITPMTPMAAAVKAFSNAIYCRVACLTALQDAVSVWPNTTARFWRTRQPER